MYKLLIIMALLYYPAISFAFDATPLLQGIQSEVNRRQNLQNEEINRQEQEAAEERFRAQQRRQQLENERRKRETQAQQHEAQNQQLKNKLESFTRTHLDEVDDSIRTLLNGKNLQNCFVSKYIGVNIGKDIYTGPNRIEAKTKKYTGCAIYFSRADEGTQYVYFNRVSRKGETIAYFRFSANTFFNNQPTPQIANCYYRNNKINEALSNIHVSTAKWSCDDPIRRQNIEVTDDDMMWSR